MKKSQKNIVAETAIQPDKIKKKINLRTPTDITNRYTNFSTVQSEDNNIYTLSFFEIQKPILLGTAEEISAMIEMIDSVPAVCVSRVVMTKDHFVKLLAAMQNHIRE